MFNKNQKEILQRSNVKLKLLSTDRLFDIANSTVDEGTLSDSELIEFLTIANSLYRGGEQIISDAEYDFTFTSELRSRQPNHPYLNGVEPESSFSGKTVDLPTQMLSTEKAYSDDEIQTWINRIQKASNEIAINFDDLVFRITPKLDGFAAYDDGERLYTRGDGKRGTDITRVIKRGLVIANSGSRGLGAGEIVVSIEYFQKNLSNYFENTRNFQASVVKEKELEKHAAKAIKDKAAVFYPFAILPSWEGTYKELEDNYDATINDIWNSVGYDVDGIIIEIKNNDLKKYMGATRHHHRWQIAFKKNAQTAKVKVLRVISQTSRTGRINPVAEVEPIRLSGATIKKASAHHYGMVKSNCIGKNAVIELVRSGEVIPKIVKVLEPTDPDIPELCPSCKSKLIWDGDYLHCTNTINCPDQITQSIEHFFSTLGNIDGFGTATITKFYKHGIKSVLEVYQQSIDDFMNMDFGPKQSENLYNQLLRSRTEKIEDWRFLSAFGLPRMGAGNCEKLLTNHRLEEMFNLTIENISSIDGFADKTATFIVKGLKTIHHNFNSIYELGFNIERTPLMSELVEDGKLSSIIGKLIVFTGSMKNGSRSNMQVEAKKLGAKVGTSVTGKTDFLVTGDKVGASKIKAAESKGVKVLTEDEYFLMISKK